MASVDAAVDGSEKSGAEPNPSSSPLKKTWLRVFIAILIAALIIGSATGLYHWWTHGRFVENTDDAYLQSDQVIVSSKISGTIAEVYVADNQDVAAGERLVRIDDALSRARVSQASAQVAQAQANISQYRAQMREQEAMIAQAKAQAEGARAKLAYDDTEVERYAPLSRTGAETEQKLAEAVYNRNAAVAALKQTDASVAQAQRHMATLAAEVDVATAQAKAAEAQGMQAQVDVDTAVLNADGAGRVGDRQARVGAYAVVGTPLLTLVPVQSLYVVANFKETQIALMRVGQPASIKVDALPGEEISGTVESFSPATGAELAVIPASNATGNFTKIVQRVPVRIVFDADYEARRVLVPGLSVTVDVDTLGSRDDARSREQEDEAGRERREQQRNSAVQQDRAAQQRDRQRRGSGAAQ